jgi:hypothetical protein
MERSHHAGSNAPTIVRSYHMCGWLSGLRDGPVARPQHRAADNRHEVRRPRLAGWSRAQNNEGKSGELLGAELPD